MRKIYILSKEKKCGTTESRVLGKLLEGGTTNGRGTNLGGAQKWSEAFISQLASV